MAKLYADENFPQPAVEALRELGHDVLTTVDSGKAGQAIPDEAVLAFSTEEQQIVLTLNRKHFIRLHRDQPKHAGIIVCTFDADFNALATHIHEALETKSDMAGELIRVNRSG